MRSLASLTVAAALFAPTAARAHETTAWVSPGGIDFVAEQVPSYVPTYLAPPPMTKQLFSCAGRPVTATQRDTQVDLAVDAFDLSVPQDGILRLDLTMSVWADGELYVDNPYACFGSATCQDDLSIWGARAIIDFDVSVGAGGKANVELAQVDLQVAPDDIYFALSDCAIDDVVNWVVDFGKDWFLDFLLEKVEDIAAAQLEPMLEQMLSGFTSYNGTLGIASFAAALDDIDVRTSGITLGADVDFTNGGYPAATCIGDDPGEPQSHAGSSPSFAGTNTHLGVAVNLGLLDDALYQVWRNGLVCLDQDRLANLGFELPVDLITGLIPGFVPGTTVTLEASLSEPPTIASTGGNAATLTLTVKGVNVDLIGTLPDQSTKGLHVELDAHATAVVAVDPTINALVLEVSGATIDRFVMDDQIGATEIGFDAARMRQVIETRMMPKMLEELGKMPMTGPVFNFADYYVLLRKVSTTDSHLVANADLFRAPAEDWNAPATALVDQPGPLANPDNAIFRVRAADEEIPEELIRYRVRINGVAAEPTWVKQFKVGEVGVTADYTVSVTALDLKGNEDPTPVTATVKVDGVAPHVKILGERHRELSDTELHIEWSMSDDLTDTSAMPVTVIIYEVGDRDDWTTADLVAKRVLDPGTTALDLELEPGTLYRIEVHATDEAGNDTLASMMTQLQGGGGCNAGGRSSANLLLLLGVAALVVARRRR
jgi:hypothetical protein